MNLAMKTAMVWTGATGILAVWAWYYKRQFFYAAKVLPVAGLIVIVGWSVFGYGLSGWPVILVLFALAFSLTGDVCIMLDKLTPGLGAFLAAHILYSVAFFKMLYVHVPGIIVIIAGAVYAAVIIFRMRGDVRRQMAVPVSVYVVAITAMLYIVLCVDLRGKGFPYLSTGAVLFYISDAVLAWDTFAGKFKAAQGILLLTYFLAQGFIVSGALAMLGRAGVF